MISSPSFTNTSLILYVSTLLNFCSCSYNTELPAQIWAKYFSSCSIITLTSEYNPSDLPLVSDLDQNFKQHSFLKDIFPPSQYIIGLQTMKEIDGSRDLRKHTQYCRLVVTFVPDGTRFNGTKFFDFLYPREYPISLRDVDHHVFLLDTSKNEQEQIKSVLLSDISQELRYKVLLPSSASSSVFTFCLYCENTVGNPKGPNAIITVQDASENSLSTSLYPDFASNLHGHPLKVVGPTKYVSLYEMERVPGTDRYEHKRGMFAEFFFIMQGKLNFSYILKPCSGFGSVIPEGNTGVQFPNGTWAGCVADIYYGWADLSMGGSPAADRLHYVEFSTNMRYDYVQFFTHGPKTVYPWTVAFACFDMYGWMCVIVSCIIATLLLYVTENFKDTPGPKMSTVSLYLFANLLGQELAVEPRTVSSKVTFVYWIFYGIVVGSAYACSLQSLIVSPGLSMVPKTMSELARSAPGWSCGVPLSFRNGLAETIFRKAKNPDMKKLYRETQEDKDAVNCLTRAATTDYACFHWQIMAEFYMGTVFIDKAGNHPFLYAKDYILFSGPTWMTRKREIWRHAFNDFFGRQFSLGIVYEASARDRRNVRRQLVQEVKEGKRKPLQSYTLDDDGPKPFTFDNVQACFIILLIGLVLSTIKFMHDIITKDSVIRLLEKCKKCFQRFSYWCKSQ